ncbi:MAG: hypothetical protein KGJ80_21700, partial [Chloroflexota bacterium]|nr:hypothetical protein [Chloroflexota bacterium]
ATVMFFVCAGWAVPFTVWGQISTASADSPQWAGLIGVVSGVAFVVATIATFGGFWWGAYWLLTRVTAKPSER